MKLNNGIEIPQLGVGTWTLRGATARENVRMAEVVSELFSEPTPSFSELSLLPYGWELLQRTSNCSRSFQKIFQIHIIYNNKHEYCHVFTKRLVF